MCVTRFDYGSPLATAGQSVAALGNTHKVRPGPFVMPAASPADHHLNGHQGRESKSGDANEGEGKVEDMHLSPSLASSLELSGGL
jgi:hypothetical protein